MMRALNNNGINGMLELLQKFIGTIPYTDNTNYEGQVS